MERLWPYKMFLSYYKLFKGLNNASICPQYIFHFRHLFENYTTPTNLILLRALADAKSQF